MRISRLLVGLLVPATFACAANEANLAPAPGAQPAPGPGQGAVAMEAGVRMEARVDAWDARPANLEDAVTPVLVEITNNSSSPMLVRYNAFQLVGPQDQTFSAIPPFDLEAEVTQPVTTPAFTYTGFGVAPYLSPYYPGVDPFVGDFAFDAGYYGTHFPAFREIDLPTADMVQMALPEGVLEPGGSVTGFLYFQDVGDADVPRVVYTAELVNARTGQQFGTVEIPFVVQ